MHDTLIRNSDAPIFQVEGTRVTGYASPSRGSATVSAWRLVLQPGAASPVHALTHDEVFIAIRGEATITLGDRALRLAAGDGISIPPETIFRIANESSEPFEAVACMAAGGQARVGDQLFTPPWAV